ncbi:DUF3866 family protein [Natranaerofaba carboxydovora]|uniref:DUF3866 family protein n=1 Tax=Natranaerofaba carboxydovora TaxID=2742683 RepID=UPI001F13A5A7|nr:DUF3866 family protein [Natranaerofaba carboxydovora]UMZ73930.1 hypothetical protein ACONDI_01500 [Natranaerofaba carboxydovora]
MARISLNIGNVNRIIQNTPDYQVLEIKVDKEKRTARLYKKFCFETGPGETVLINQVARDLKLGSGGEDFVVSNLSKPTFKSNGDGHIMKLRYTPYQFAVPSIEEYNDYKSAEREFTSLWPMKVAVGELHSMVAPIAYGVKKNRPDTKIVYIMTDAAALPLELSNSISKLKKEDIIHKTITVGNAFGGDYEAVNIYSALISAKMLFNSDFAIITMGPGIVGTATALGFSGMEQVENLMAVNKLGGKGILVPRISFSDKRERHRGLSHHTKRILSFLDNSVDVPMPLLSDKNKLQLLKRQCKEIKNITKVGHKFLWLQSEGAIKFFKKINHPFMTMGRDLDSDNDFFETLYVVSKWFLKC